MTAFSNLPDGPNNWLLRLIAAAFWNNDGTRRSTQSASAAGFASTTTAALAVNYTALASHAANRVEIFNMTGITLNIRRVADPGNVFRLPANTSKVFAVIANSNELEVASSEDGAVTFDWEWVKN